MARDSAILAVGKGASAGAAARYAASTVMDFGAWDLWRFVQVPMLVSRTIPKKARRENHARLDCPLVSTNAAKSGPRAEPALPPTWKSDCAMPCCPPDAMRATREDSGWNTAEPIPMSAAAARTVA